MMTETSAHPIKRLESIVDEANLFSWRPPGRYDPGHVFDLEIEGVFPACGGRAKLVAERFVGGGFAGQVYRARLVQLELMDGSIPGLEVGDSYAVKILVPPTGGARLFRNALYWLGYQSSFGPQVNRAAARAGALWQKLIRRGARARLGSETCIKDIYATFFDPRLGSFGEISEWVDGRTWKFEVDNLLFSRGKVPAEQATHSREYLAKKEFMAKLVRLLHDMGAPELARQYEWWSGKSQPNVLKRSGSGEGPADGLTALDFRAGLALLPFFPMSPVDFKLIVKGLARGAIVQFDRGSLEKLRAYRESHADEFADLAPAIEELETVESEYRASQPDVTRHALRLLWDRGLRRSVKDGLIQGWRVRRLIDEERAAKLGRSSAAFVLFLLAGLVPLLGRFARRLWGSTAFRKHVGALFTSVDYIRRAFSASRAECLIDWCRSGRADERLVEKLLARPFCFWSIRLTQSWLPLPSRWHRFSMDPAYAWQSAKSALGYLVRFYRDADFRVAWLTQEVEEGAREGMLTPEEREQVLQRVPDPFIQKYLKCVAVHLCTLPLTQVVSTVAAVYVAIRYGKSWAEAVAYGATVLAGFQVLPVSPGSLVRGTYVVYLMIKERNWRNYWLAVLVSYWHYVGYLGFPLQMAREFPILSRFMAGRWATRMVRFVPVFGERGGLPEHLVFDIFFNLVLSIGRFLGRR